MARPRRYETDAAKQAAYRERKRHELELTPEEQVYAAQARGLSEQGAEVNVTVQAPFPVDVVVPVSLSEEEYVRREVEITRRQIEGGQIPVQRIEDGKLVNDQEERLRRSAEYARWRYRAYLAAEVASL